MPFIDGRTISEVLMRPGIHGRFLAHKDLGASRVSLLMNRAEPGAAVPLHMHQVEETVVMFEGRIWVQLGEERRVIGPNDTVIIPPLTPHAWVHGGNGGGPHDVGVWRPRSLYRFHLLRRPATQAARLSRLPARRSERDPARPSTKSEARLKEKSAFSSSLPSVRRLYCYSFPPRGR
jgi:quercetin dioxygenase-like cupin family protein